MRMKEQLEITNDKRRLWMNPNITATKGAWNINDNRPVFMNEKCRQLEDSICDAKDFTLLTTPKH